MGPESLLEWVRARRQRLEIVAVALLVVYFLVCIRHALHTYFSDDDLMNLYVAWNKSWTQLWLETVQFWRAQERPVGELVYRALYALFGFNHVPFRATHIGLLAVNVVLQYLLARRLSGSRVVASLTVFLAGFHRFLWFLYASTGTIYDVLCGAAFFLALWLYAAGGRISPARTAALAVLAILAIDAKEMGITLGATMLLWEVLVARRRVVLPLLLVNLVCLAYVAGRLLLPGPISGLDPYRPVLTLARFGETATAYTNILLEPYFHLTPVAVLALWLAIAAVAALASRRALWGVLFCGLTVSPLLVIPPRGSGYVLYIPLFGLAFAIASCLGAVRWKLRAWPGWSWALAGVCFATVFFLHRAEYRRMKVDGLPLAREIGEIVDQIPRLMPAPQARINILVVNCPMDMASEWDAMYILGLQYGRRDLHVKMQRWDPVTTPLKVAESEFQYVFQYDLFARRYADITAAAYAGIEKLPPPSRASMGSSEAEVCIVNDIDASSDGKTRWARQRPEFRFTAGPGGATKFFLVITMPEVIVREAGPQRIQLFLNGEAGGRQVIQKFGEFRTVFDLPRELKPGAPARIRLEVANPWIAKDDGARLSFLIRAAGLE